MWNLRLDLLPTPVVHVSFNRRFFLCDGHFSRRCTLIQLFRKARKDVKRQKLKTMAPKRSKKVAGTVVQTRKKVVHEIVKLDIEMSDLDGKQKPSELLQVVENGVDGTPVSFPTESKKEKESENSEETREEIAERKKKRRRKRRGSSVGVASGGYKTYVFRVLKQVHPGMRVSAKAMSVIDGMMCDMFERIAEEAAQLSKYTGRLTLSSKEIQDAVRLIMPGELGKHANSEGLKAVTTYMGK